MTNPHHHSAVASSIYDVIDHASDLDILNNQDDAGTLAARIAERIEREYKMNIGRRGARHETRKTERVRTKATRTSRRVYIED